jgi:hypothetical protein
MARLSVLAVLIASAALTVGVGVPSAKEGVRAIVLSGLPTRAPAGTTITVRWRLADADGRPVDLLEAFMRLVGPGGVTRVGLPTETAHPDGLYDARVRVPPGGAVAVQFGVADGGTTDLFPLRNDPFGGWSSLYRPLHVPALDAGALCPVTGAASDVDFGQFGVSRGYGPGPAYPIGFDPGTTVRLRWTEGDAGAWPWGVQKVLWFVHPSYSGPVLIRGRQLDGPQQVRFDRGVHPPPEIRIDPSRSPEGRGRPSFVRLLAPGCYAFQVDGTSFSRLVVFRAVR